MAKTAKRRGGNRLERNDRLVRMALLVTAFSAVSITWSFVVTGRL